MAYIRSPFVFESARSTNPPLLPLTDDLLNSVTRSRLVRAPLSVLGYFELRWEPGLVEILLKSCEYLADFLRLTEVGNGV